MTKFKMLWMDVQDTFYWMTKPMRRELTAEQAKRKYFPVQGRKGGW